MEKPFSFFLICCLSIASCGSIDRQLEQALVLSGDNRGELERVLAHYASDSLKVRATRFLIVNMLGKGTIPYVYKETDGVYEQLAAEPDLEYIKADYLIENIDLAFEVWQKYSWCRQLSFDEFCRSVLPYRLKQEPLDRWRAFYYEKYRVVADSLSAAGFSMQEVVFFFNKHYGKKYIHAMAGVPGDLSVSCIEESGGGTCDHLALNAVQQMRAIGIPLNMDLIPFHGKVNGGHAYNSFTDENGRFFYFSPYERQPERQRWIAPLVQRVCYELNFTPSIERNKWNALFVNNQLKNVTEQYYETRDVSLPVCVKDTIVYLCTFNRGKFKVVAQSKVNEMPVASYSKVSCGLLYFQMSETEGELLPVGLPFVPTEDSVRMISPVHNSSVLDGVRLYDVKKELELGKEPYMLFYWDNGWMPVKAVVSKDTHVLDFGKLSLQSLFWVCGDTYMGRMQRPFLLEEGQIVYY